MSVLQSNDFSSFSDSVNFTGTFVRLKLQIDTLELSESGSNAKWKSFKVELNYQFLALLNLYVNIDRIDQS